MKKFILAVALLFVATTAFAVTTGDKWTFEGPVTFTGTVTETGAKTQTGAITQTGAVSNSGSLTLTGTVLDPNEDTTAVNTLTADECGKTIFLNSSTEFATTLPAISTVSGGCKFDFIVKTAPSGTSYTVITGNSLENVMIGGINELEVDTSNDGPSVTAGDTITFTQATSVVGDYVSMVSDGTSWYFNGQAAADGGVVPTQAD